MPEQPRRQNPIFAIPQNFVDGVQSVTIKEGNNDRFFEERSLPKVGRRRDLWALGVGVVIAGQAFGWNRVACSGLGGILIAFALVALLYSTVIHTLAEITSLLPISGSIFSFARDVWGPFWGWIVGLLECLEWMLTSAAYLAILGDGLSSVLPISDNPLGPKVISWTIFAFVACFVGLLRGRALWNLQFFQVCATLLIMLVLIFHSLPFWDPLSHSLSGNAWEPSAWFPQGIEGVLSAFPTAMWLFLGIESVPFAAEEVGQTQDLSSSMIWGMRTLSATALPMILSAIFIPTGAPGVCASDDSVLLHGLTVVTGNPTGIIKIAISIASMVPLWTSFISSVIVTSRMLFSLSRSGYLSTKLSTTHPLHHTPFKCTILAIVCCFLLTCLINLTPSKINISQELVLMSVCAGCFVYIIIGISYFHLQRLRRYYQSPYRSPLGQTGAFLSILISIFVFATMVFKEREKLLFLGILIGILALGCSYFFLAGLQKKLVKGVQTRYGLAVEVEYAKIMRRKERRDRAMMVEMTSAHEDFV